MDDDTSNPFRRMSSRTRKFAPKMVAALASRALARLEALENDNAGIETVKVNDEDKVCLHKMHSKSMKRKTRQAKALEARKAPRTFIELLHEANLESFPAHIPCYLKAAVGPPSSTSRCHFCTVCGSSASYTCVRCGMHFCARRCQNIHNDTCCLKFVARSYKVLKQLTIVNLSYLILI